jgi:DNA repair exonuclease SbcCD ATPase subunit
MRITAVYARNFKRLQDVEIRPDADRTLILIGGKNANGKSSLLDALSTAFGGKKLQPADPVRHGADEATIRVELDGGELEVRRVIQPGGESVLEVRDRLGAVKAPQAMLDKLVGARFLDPLAFLSLAPKEQRAQLMKLIPGAQRIAELNERQDRAFKRRTEVGRELTKAEGELARLPVVEPGTPIDVGALTAEQRAFAEQQRAGDGLGAVVKQAETAAASANDRLGALLLQIDDLQRRLNELKAKVPELEAAHQTRLAELEAARARLAAAGAAWQESAPRRAELEAGLSRADAHNRAVFAAEAQQQRRADVVAEVEKLTKERAELTRILEAIDTRKAEVLAAAALPVPGLAIADDGIELGGVPLVQASDAERWRVALALAIAAAPGLSDVWIRDGALLDEDSLALVAEQAAAAGKRVWIERVGTRDPGVIEIRDGRVARSTAETEAA